jgi:hypothetical protein
MHVTKSRSIAFAFALVLAACSGSEGHNGAAGPQGPAGQDGSAGGTGGTGGTGPQGPAGLPGSTGANLTATAEPESCGVCHGNAGADHQALYNSFDDGLAPATSKLSAQVDSVVTTAGTNANTFKSTLTFKLTKNGQPLIDAVDPSTVGSAALGGLKQKTYYFVAYDGAGKFPTSTTSAPALNFSYGSPKHLGGKVLVNNVLVDNGQAGTYTVVKDNLATDPLAAPNAFVYAYFGDTLLNIPTNTVPGTHYALMDNVASVAQVVTGTVNYTSTVNAKGCEKCHPEPYSKHGYRQAHVAGLNDFVACKACHTDQRAGTDAAWYLLADDPAASAAQGGVLTPAQLTKYAYTANVMNDTHNSHAFEFAYPQSMANCVTCHEGKLDRVLTDANFTVTTCKSCHPVTGPTPADPKRAPGLKSLLTAAPLDQIHTMDLYTFAGDCNICHTTGGVAKTFSQIPVSLYTSPSPRDA